MEGITRTGRVSAAHRGSGPGRLVARTLALVGLIGALLAMLLPAAAQAFPLSTMRVSSRIFPSGLLVPGGEFGTIPVLGGGVALTAPQYVYEPSTPPGTLGTVYEFMFWDVDATLITTDRATFAVSSSEPSLATAWYMPVCVVSSSCSGGGTTAVTTWAFSLTSYKVLPGTPIKSVTPSTAWTAPSTTVSTATAVTIDALSYQGAIPVTPLSGGTVFSKWFVFGGTTTVSGPANEDLSVPAGESPYAIAFYYYVAPHTKPICIGYPYCI